MTVLVELGPGNYPTEERYLAADAIHWRLDLDASTATSEATGEALTLDAWESRYRVNEADMRQVFDRIEERAQRIGDFRPGILAIGMTPRRVAA